MAYFEQRSVPMAEKKKNQREEIYKDSSLTIVREGGFADFNNARDVLLLKSVEGQSLTVCHNQDGSFEVKTDREIVIEGGFPVTVIKFGKRK
jgi:hypothetical protein